MSYSILVNGEPKGDNKPSCGIKQGDPLFLYLFLLCSEGLNRMLQKVVEDNKIRGFSLYNNGPYISYLFFADDSLLFCCANLDELNTIQGLLSLYKKALGQQLNRAKTTLFFSKHVSNGRKEEL